MAARRARGRGRGQRAGGLGDERAATPDQDGAKVVLRLALRLGGRHLRRTRSPRLPGFVGGEPEQPVPRDVVAVMMPGQDGAQWSVDFWVGQIERAVPKAEELAAR